MACLVRLEEAHCAFEPKHLLDTLLLLAKPVVEIRTTGDLAVFQPSMPFVPRLRLLPSSPTRGAIFQQIGDIPSQRRLVVLGQEDVLPSQPMHLGAQRTLGMHGIYGEDASFDVFRRQERFERADFILFGLHIAVPPTAGSDWKASRSSDRHYL